MATETDYLREVIKAQGGSCDDLPDNLESTLYKKLIETCAAGGGGSGGGGGGGLPTGGEPHQMLVTDAEGNAQWEDKLCYETFEDVVCLPEMTLTADPDIGGFVVPAFVATPVEGGVYTVNWNGTEYTCMGKTITDDGITAVTLGSAAVMGGEYTDDPFFIMCLPEELAATVGVAAQILPLNGSPSSITISIHGKQPVLKKLDPKFVEIKGETVFLPVSITNDWQEVNTHYPYSMLLGLVNAGKNIIMEVHTSISDGKFPVFLRLGAIDAAGMHFMGHASATGEVVMITVPEDGEMDLSIGNKSMTLISADGTPWNVWVEDDGTLRTSML